MNNQISTSTNYAVMALAGVGLLVTTAGTSPQNLWVLPFKMAFNIDVSETSGAITNYLPVQKTQSSLTVPDVIIQAQTNLGISKSHLATVFNMSRQNLDKLLKNNEQKPTQETEARAMQVKQVLDIISKACPYKLGASTMTCRINGRRLFDELIKNEINCNEVLIFAKEINRRISTQQQSNLPESVRRNQEFLDTFNAA